MNKYHYQGISLSKELLDRIGRSIEGMGYVSKTDFIRQAIHKELARISKIKQRESEKQ